MCLSLLYLLADLERLCWGQWLLLRIHLPLLNTFHTICGRGRNYQLEAAKPDTSSSMKKYDMPLVYVSQPQSGVILNGGYSVQHRHFLPSFRREGDLREAASQAHQRVAILSTDRL